MIIHEPMPEVNITPVYRKHRGLIQILLPVATAIPIIAFIMALLMLWPVNPIWVVVAFEFAIATSVYIYTEIEPLTWPVRYEA